MFAKNSARELEKINNEYWNLREVDIAVLQLPEGDVTELIVDTNVINSIGTGFPSLHKGQTINVGFKIKKGKLSLIGR
jgi:hypothetical protein